MNCVESPVFCRVNKGRNHMKKILLLLTAIILLPVGLLGQVGGTIRRDTTWGPGIVTVTSDIDVYKYVLTIAPGTTIRIYDNVKIYVPTRARIIADGNETDKIIFEAFNNSWNHIELNGSSGNLFSHCIFRDGSDLLYWPWKGGAVYINLSSATFTHCTFTNNSAQMGGAVTVYQSSVQLTDCDFYENTAERGGAIHIQEDESDLTPSDTVTIDRCRIYQNSANQTGGIHIADNSTALIQNSLIYNNVSNTNGGIATNNFSGSSLGWVTMINCVVANNTTHDISFRGSARTTAQNCIFWGSEQSVFFLQEDPQSSNLSNCAVQGAYKNSEINIASTFTNSFKLNSLNSAVDGPNFVNPLTDYSILAVSPCKDQGISTGGVPSTDILGYTRTAPYDIGAYEVQRQLISWTGAVSSDWMSNGNWSPASIPGSNDDVRISDAGNSPIISSGTGLSYNLIIESPAELTIETGGSLNATGSVIINSSAVSNSGSVINQGTATGTVVYNRTIPDDGTTQLWHYISSPVVTDSVVTSKEFYPWNEVAGEWGSPVSGLSPGIGYTVIGGGSVSFIGSLQPSDFSVDATSPYNDVLTGTNYSGRTYVQGDGHSHITRSFTNYGGGGFNLLGNPFTSAMRISDSDGNSSNDFLSANQGKFDPNYVAVYIYDGDSYGYIGQSTGWTTDNPSQLTGTEHVQVGQAFFVLAMNDYAEFSFKREMQVHNTTVPLLKSAGSDRRWPGIQLKVRNSEKESSTLIVYDPDMSADLDPGYDIGFISGGAAIEIYSHLPGSGNVNYTRQALPLAGADSVIIPIGIDTRTGGEIIFSSDAVTFKSYRYLLEDRQKGIFVDISNREYKTTVAPETFGTGRFYLHTAYADRRIARPSLHESESAEVQIWTYGHDIIIKGPLSAGSLCEVFSLQGQKVLSVSLENEELNTISSTSQLKGTYIVRVTDGEKVYTAKVFIR